MREGVKVQRLNRDKKWFGGVDLRRTPIKWLTMQEKSTWIDSTLNMTVNMNMNMNYHLLFTLPFSCFPHNMGEYSLIHSDITKGKEIGTHKHGAVSPMWAGN